MLNFDVVVFILLIFLIIVIIPTAIVIIIGVYYFCFLGVCTMIEDITEQIEKIKIKRNKKIFSKSLDKNKKM